MKLVVYVEGPGDQVCLEALLRPLIATKREAGIAIEFVPARRGDRKVELLTNAPVRAANIICNDPDAHVAIVPDLYPSNKAFPHTTCAEMQSVIKQRFEAALMRNTSWDQRMADRFRVFCLIHDLEVLLLAAEESLLQDRGVKSVTWTRPVEEQDHGNPPKRVVEQLFRSSGASYDPTIDGPRILEAADWQVIRDRCPNGFGAFASFLESLEMPS